MIADVYDEIQTEIWATREGHACARLTVSQIAEAFADEAPALCRRHIRRLSRVINPWLDEIRMIKSACDNSLQESFYLGVALWKAPRFEIEHRKLLRGVLALTTVKCAQNTANFEGISSNDVDYARAVGIEGLYSWDKPKRLGPRFTACCPFHQENTPSFFIFKDNKFKCFSCGAHGDAIEFQMRISNCDFIEAVKYLRKT